tara:strand:- start:1449 stop:1970 length:522 start_codon:yes stop_codon:yes gene_type:complete
MARFASNKYALGISDRSGAAYPLRNMRKEWTGLLVGKDEWESKQPQLTTLRVVADPEALQDARPDRTEPAVDVLLSFNAFTSGSSGSSVITVSEPGNSRSTGDVVRFRTVRAFDGFTEAVLEAASGYSITVVASSVEDEEPVSYTFTVSGETASTGSVQGGGAASAGPVTTVS